MRISDCRGGLGIYLALGHDERLVPVANVGSLLAIASMLMFLGLVLADMLRFRRQGFDRPEFKMTAQSG